MLDKHKKIIEKKLNNKKYEVSNSFLRVKLDNNNEITNAIIDNKSIWYVKDLVVTVDKINIDDCVGLITIASTGEYIHIKILATEVYVEYNAINAKKYNINSVNKNLILAIIEDFNNKKCIINRNDLSILLELINDDINELFDLIEENKEDYIDEYNHELNNLRADYVMKENKILKKIKTLNKYSEVIDK